MERREWKLSGDEVIFEPPDLIISRGHGEIRSDSLKEMLPIFEELCSDSPKYLVVDLTFLNGVKLSMNNDQLKGIKTTWFKGMVVVKAGTVMRLAVKGLYLATGYFRKESYLLEFAESMEAAYAILKADRKKQAAAAK